MSEKEKSHLETIKAAMNLLPEKKTGVHHRLRRGRDRRQRSPRPGVGGEGTGMRGPVSRRADGHRKGGGFLKLEINEKGVYYVFPERKDTPEEQRLDKLLEGSGWESPQPGTRMKLHPELMSPAQIEFIIQHETNPEIIDFFRRNQSKAQSWLS